MEINVNNTAKWQSKTLPVNTYFIVENEKEHEGKIFLKIYNGGAVNILNGNETFSSHVDFKECVIINKLKISIEQL